MCCIEIKTQRQVDKEKISFVNKKTIKSKQNKDFYKILWIKNKKYVLNFLSLTVIFATSVFKIS